MLDLAIILQCTALTWTAAAQADQGPARPIDVQPSVATGDEFATALDEASAARVDELIDRLSDASYETREEATRTLVETGVTAFARLREAYRRADDLEVRLRIEAIVETAYLNHHVLDQKGFLGIRYDPYHPVIHDDEPRIREGCIGVKVIGFVADTAASRARLAKDDVIIALDGRDLVGTGRKELSAFGEGVNARRPGTPIHLTILRGTEWLEIEVVLGRAPSDLPRNSGVVSIALVQARENFDQWWDVHFRSPPADTSTQSEEPR